MTEIIEKVKQSKSERPVSQKDLIKFKKEIDALLETRFSDFVDGFLEAWSDAQNSDGEKCTCEECQKQEEFDPEKAPRYVINAGGHTYCANEVSPNPLYGLDFYLIEEINGKKVRQKGTIMSPDITLIDLRPTMDLETFTNIKKSMINTAVESAIETKAKAEAEAKKQSEIPKDININYMNYV